MNVVKRPILPRKHVLLAVDPGLRELGAALFVNGVLERVSLVENTVDKKIRGARAWSAIGNVLKREYVRYFVDEVIIEMMVVRANNRAVAPDNLLQLVGVAGVIVGLFNEADPTEVRPEHWKGQMKKRIHHPLIIKALSEAERNLFADLADLDNYIQSCRRCRGSDYPDNAVHNVLDAVGIGLNALGRKHQ